MSRYQLIPPSAMMTPYLRWLERLWARPTYGGVVLLGVAICFFGAAVNTMAGWLYVMSGGILALLIVAMVSPPRSLRHLAVTRAPIHPVHAGTSLWMELSIINPTGQARSLLEVSDDLPSELGSPTKIAVEQLDPGGTYAWGYAQPTRQRGIYRWQSVFIKSGAPLGLFWSTRPFVAPARAIVYPQVLPLTHCPLIDQIGTDLSWQTRQQQRAQSANEGLTRALRPYRWGDPTRLIHWRTSARYGELRVRELEDLISGQDLVIGLDSGTAWLPEQFEQAVIAAASLYRYAQQRSLQPELWTAGTGLVQGDRPTLETLAAVQPAEAPAATRPDHRPLLWLTATAATLETLPADSCWIWWAPPLAGSSHGRVVPPTGTHAGIAIAPDEDLQRQLQTSPH